MSEIVEERKSRLNEIALVASQGPQLKTMADVWTIAQMYHNAGMVPTGVKNAAQLMIILTAGAELGFGPTWALRNVASFNGQAMVHSDGPISLVMRSGQLEWQKSGYEGKGDSLTAWFEVKRKGVIEPVKRTFSADDAKTAGLWGKNIWKSYPTRMLMMRARAYALRDLFADVLGGIGILEEHQGEVIVEPEEVTTGSQGLLNALTKPALPEAAEEPMPEAQESWEPSPEELAEIRARELAEAGEEAEGLFGQQP